MNLTWCTVVSCWRLSSVATFFSVASFAAPATCVTSGYVQVFVNVHLDQRFTEMLLHDTSSSQQESRPRRGVCHEFDLVYSSALLLLQHLQPA